MGSSCRCQCADMASTPPASLGGGASCGDDPSRARFAGHCKTRPRTRRPPASSSPAPPLASPLLPPPLTLCPSQLLTPQQVWLCLATWSAWRPPALELTPRQGLEVRPLTLRPVPRGLQRPLYKTWAPVWWLLEGTSWASGWAMPRWARAPSSLALPQGSPQLHPQLTPGLSWSVPRHRVGRPPGLELVDPQTCSHLPPLLTPAPSWLPPRRPLAAQLHLPADLPSACVMLCLVELTGLRLGGSLGRTRRR